MSAPASPSTAANWIWRLTRDKTVLVILRIQLAFVLQAKVARREAQHEETREVVTWRACALPELAGHDDSMAGEIWKGTSPFLGELQHGARHFGGRPDWQCEFFQQPHGKVLHQQRLRAA